MAKQIVVDLGQNSYYPHKKLIEAYEDPKRGNKFQRLKDSVDTIYEDFVNRCRKNPFNIRAKRIVRTRTFVNGKLTDVLYYYAEIEGESAAGNLESWNTWIGFYDEPIFQKVLDKEKDEYVVTGVRNRIRRYELPYTPALLDNLREDGIIEDMTALTIRETPETNTAYDVYLYEDFRDASFLQLIEIGKTRKSLNDVRKIIPDPVIMVIPTIPSKEELAPVTQEDPNFKPQEEITPPTPTPEQATTTIVKSKPKKPVI